MTAVVSSVDYARAVSEVLAAELKGSHCAIKTVANWTGASERTAKNWLSGRRGPNGQHLIALLGRSDALLQLVLDLAGRGTVIEVRRLETLEDSLVQAIGTIDSLRQGNQNSP